MFNGEKKILYESIDWIVELSCAQYTNESSNREVVLDQS